MILHSRGRMLRGTLYGSSPSQGLITWPGGDDWESFEIP